MERLWRTTKSCLWEEIPARSTKRALRDFDVMMMIMVVTMTVIGLSCKRSTHVLHFSLLFPHKLVGCCRCDGWSHYEVHTQLRNTPKLLADWRLIEPLLKLVAIHGSLAPCSLAIAVWEWESGRRRISLYCSKYELSACAAHLVTVIQQMKTWRNGITQLSSFWHIQAKGKAIPVPAREGP
jgi:hypothetical protein